MELVLLLEYIKFGQLFCVRKNTCKDRMHFRYFVYCHLDLFKKVKETFGCLDIVCNNAGIGGEVYPLWEKTIDVNLVK